MPGPHRRFLEHLITVANIRDFVESNLHNGPLSSAYDQCLSALSSFRDQHLQIVSRYIVIMAAESKRKAAAAEAQTTKPAMVKEPKKEQLVGLAREQPGQAGLTGTGGTKLMPFLKQSRDETLEPATGVHKIEHSLDRAMARRDVVVPPIALNAGPEANGPLRGFSARSCKVNDFEDIPVPRVTGVGMAGDWEVGDDMGGICHY
jgi:indoleamine 2,3-dioxygenase